MIALGSSSQESHMLLLCCTETAYCCVLSNTWNHLQRGFDKQQSANTPVGTSEDWMILDSGKSFAWSAQQHGTLQQQLEALDKLIQQQGQQVCRYCICIARCTCVVNNTQILCITYQLHVLHTSCTLLHMCVCSYANSYAKCESLTRSHAC